jgi:hypothetical protein
MLENFGDGTTAQCAFEGCEEVLTYDTITADRYPISGKEGGRYIRSNIRPACVACNSADGTRIKALPPLEAGPTGMTW